MTIRSNPKQGLPSIAALFSFMLLATVASAADRGTQTEAKALLRKAVAHYKSVGREQALLDFNKKKSPFVDRDLYVMCLGPDDTFIADGGFPQVVGARADTLVEIDGKGWAAVVRHDTAATGKAQEEYLWVNPVTHAMELKTMFFATLGKDICGVGAYSPYHGKAGMKPLVKFLLIPGSE